jgi:tetratricopeptide (TPR) repeat protein
MRFIQKCVFNSQPTWRSALAPIQQTVATPNVTGRALYMVARAYEQMHMFDEALACYKESDALMSECDFGDFELWCRLAKARILWLRKDYDGSLKPLTNCKSFQTACPMPTPNLNRASRFKWLEPT